MATGAVDVLRLRVFDGDGKQVREVLVPQEGLVVGREDDCGLCLPEKAVSRRHARLYFHEGDLVVDDEGSANGVYVDGARTDGPTIVEVGQRIGIGTFVVQVEDPGQPPLPDPVVTPPRPVGPPSDATSAYVPQLVAWEGAHEGERFPIQDGETTVGRVQGNDIVLDDVSVSRKHARLVRAHGTFTLVDLESSNGTRVNGSKVTRAQLTHGDTISFGDISMIFTTRAGDTGVLVARRRTVRKVRLVLLGGALVLLAAGLVLVLTMDGC